MGVIGTFPFKHRVDHAHQLVGHMRERDQMVFAPLARAFIDGLEHGTVPAGGNGGRPDRPVQTMSIRVAPSPNLSESEDHNGSTDLQSPLPPQCSKCISIIVALTSFRTPQHSIYPGRRGIAHPHTCSFSFSFQGKVILGPRDGMLRSHQYRCLLERAVQGNSSIEQEEPW
jgi:hypothetical protein